jgi:hypothetical protein
MLSHQIFKPSSSSPSLDHVLPVTTYSLRSLFVVVVDFLIYV